MNKYIGIDVAKATLQVYIPKSRTDLEFENSPAGLKKLYAVLKKQYKDEINIDFHKLIDREIKEETGLKLKYI